MQSQRDHLDNLFHHLGIDPSSPPTDQINELMNFALQCLGGIRILSQQIEVSRKSNMLNSVDKSFIFQKEGEELWAVRKSFNNAVQFQMRVIVSAEVQDNADPSSHIVESFPNSAWVGKKTWMASHWAILGNPEAQVHSRDSNSANDDSIIDERIIIVNQLADALPSSFAEVDKEGRSVLHIAARLDSVPLFESVLVNCKNCNGASIKDINLNGALPLHNTARFSHSYDVFKRVQSEYPEAIFIRNNEGLLPLHWAAVKNCSVKIVRGLIESYPDGIREENNEGYLPLHCAGQNDCLEVVQTIYEAYPDAIKLADHEGGLPLHHACALAKNISVVEFIYNAYPDAISVPQEHEITPIHLAASQNDRPEIIRFLVEKYPPGLEKKDSEGWIALRCIMEHLNHHINTNLLLCFSILLHGNPNTAVVIQTEERSFLNRLALNAFPSNVNWHSSWYEIYRDMNWSARANAIKLVLSLAQEDGHLAPDNDPELLRKLFLQQVVNSPGRKRIKNRLVSIDEIRHDKASVIALDSQIRHKKIKHQIQLTKTCIIVLRRLCRHFMTPVRIAEIPPGILRSIIQFL